MAMLVMREVIVAMLVMRAVMQPVEDELADDDGWLERVILEGCPFLWGWRGYSSGGRGDFCWGGRGMSVGREGNLRRENRYPPYPRRKGIWEG